jgi:CubicO group peptidase (beta-lactamase class C family)
VEAMRYHSLRGADELALEIGSALNKWYLRLNNPSSAQGTEAIVKLAAGQHEQGMALLRLAHARNAAGQSSSRRMIATAREYQASGRAEEALRILTAARELHPSNANVASAYALMIKQRDPLNSFARQVDSLRATHHIPGLAVVMLRDTSIVFTRVFGLADVESGRTITTDTPFDIASVTKPIAAVVALRLAADGVLDLDRSMRTYRNFSEFCSDTRSQGGIFFSDYACTNDRLTLRHVLGMRANGEPGTRFLYNPPSYSWASRPMAEVTGKTFSQLVDSLVFRPAGMKRSARINRQLPLPAALAADLAIPYTVDSTGRITRATPPPPQGDGAAGGVISTAMDLARFDIALMTGKLLPPKFRSMLWQQDNLSIPYGLGWFLGNHDGKRVAWHTGLWEGRYSALYLKVLGEKADERATLILLANSDGLRWPSALDEATIERSDFANAFFSILRRPSRRSISASQ